MIHTVQPFFLKYITFQCKFLVCAVCFLLYFIIHYIPSYTAYSAISAMRFDTDSGTRVSPKLRGL